MYNVSNYFKYLLFLIFVSMSFSLAAQKVEYYRHLVFRETPFADTRGNHPIDKKSAEHEVHYRFVYDAQDRLVEVSRRLGDHLIADNGNWDSFIWFSPKVTISYSDGKETRHYYDHLDQRIAAHGNMYEAVFELDEKGRRVALRFFDRDGQPSESAWGIHRYAWSYLDDGNILESRYNLKDEPRTIRPDFTFYTVRLEYGTDDLLDFMYHLDDEGNIINNAMKAGMDRIVYDQEENFSRWMVFDENLMPSEGNAPEFAIGEHLYDCRGNKVELRGFDVIGQPKAMPGGVARVLNTYDARNNQTEVKTLDLNGNLLQHVKREFSVDGRRIEWIKFYDENGDVTLAPNGQFAAIKFEYNDDGSLAAQKLFDQQLNEI